MIAVIAAFAVSFAGVVLFSWLDLPLPWLLGPLTTCLIAALCGVPLGGISKLNAGMRTILGVAVGTTLTPVVLVSFPAMWPTLILMPVMVFLIALIGVPYFQRVCGYDFPTAYFSAMPGGLQDMIVFGEEAGGNVRTLSLIHATRVLVIVAALPFLLKGIWGADLSLEPGAPIGSISAQNIVLMVVAALLGWWGAVKIGMFGASILGPLILTAIITLAGFITSRPPSEAIWAAQFFIGMSVGSKYSGITMVEVRRDLVAGIGFCVILMVLTVIFVEGITLTGLAPGMEALLAFAPGGQAELVVLALIVGADAAFVIAHHILRIIVVILGAPLAARRFKNEPQD